METTPVSTRHKSRLRNRSNDSSDTITSYVNAMEHKRVSRSAIVEEDDEDEEAFPPTQVFQQVRKKGEVFWDYDASPNSARDDLRKKMMQDDSPGQTRTPPRPLEPTIKLRAKSKPQSSPEIDDDDMKFFNDCKKLSDAAMMSEIQSPLLVCKPLINGEVVDSNQNSEICKVSVKQSPGDPFADDDDDDFDDLLSQIEMPPANENTSTLTVLSKKNLHQPVVVPPKSTLDMPSENRVILPPRVENSKSNVPFKRHSSADTVQPKSVSSCVKLKNDSVSGTTMKSWQRSQSSPSIGTQKCTKEEIERKRQAALQKRNLALNSTLPNAHTSKSNEPFKRYNSADNVQLNSSRIRNNSGNLMKSWQRNHSSPTTGTQKCSKEEIERKKQAAIQRRNERSQR